MAQISIPVTPKMTGAMGSCVNMAHRDAYDPAWLQSRATVDGTTHSIARVKYGVLIWSAQQRS